MTKYRKLHTQIIESDDFNSMPDDFTRLTWTLLMLVLDREGRALDNLSNLRAKIYPLRDDVTINQIKLAFNWFAEHGMIIRYEVEGKRYFYQTQFAKYQGDTSREGYSIYPPPPGFIDQVDPIEKPEEDEESIEQVAESVPTPELVKTYARPTQDLNATNSRSSSASTLESSSALDSASASPPILPLSRDKPNFTHERRSSRPPPLPPSHPSGNAELSEPEIDHIVDHTVGIWSVISNGYPIQDDRTKIRSWGAIWGYMYVDHAFEVAVGRYNTLPEIYDSLGNGASAPGPAAGIGE